MAELFRNPGPSQSTAVVSIETVCLFAIAASIFAVSIGLCYYLVSFPAPLLQDHVSIDRAAPATEVTPRKLFESPASVDMQMVDYVLYMQAKRPEREDRVVLAKGH
jgi:hypothetical protein